MQYIEKIDYYKNRNIDILDLTHLFRKYVKEVESINEHNIVVKIEDTSSLQLIRNAIIEYRKARGYKFVVKLMTEDYFDNDEYLKDVKAFNIDRNSKNTRVRVVMKLFAYVIHDLSVNVIMPDEFTNTVLETMLRMNRALIATTSFGKSLTYQDKLLSIYNMPPVGIIAPRSTSDGQCVRAYIASSRPLIKLICDVYKEDGTVLRNHKVTFGGATPFSHTLDLVRETAEAIKQAGGRLQGIELAKQIITKDENTIDIDSLVDIRTIAEKCRTYEGFLQAREEYPQLASLTKSNINKNKDNMDISRVLITENNNERTIYLVKDIKCDIFRRNESVNIGMGSSYTKHLSTISIDKVVGGLVGFDALNKNIFYGEDTYDYFLNLYKDLFLDSYRNYNDLEKENFILYLMEVFADRYGQFLVSNPKAVEVMTATQSLVKASNYIMEDFINENIEELLDFISSKAEDYSHLIAPPYSTIYNESNLNMYSFPNGVPYLDFVLSNETCSKYRQHYISKGRVARDALDVYGLNIGIMQLPFINIVPVNRREGISIKFPLKINDED